MAPEWLLAVGMDVGLGPLADRPISLWDESFIPMVLRDAVRKVSVTNPDGTSQPLVAGERQWVPATGDESATALATPVRPPDWRLPFALAGFGFAALLALLSLARAKRASRIVFGILAVLFWLMCSLAGLTLVAMWAATEHWGAWRNENLLLLNPLCLLLIPAAFDVAWSRKLVAPIALAAAGTLLFKLVEPLFATGDFALHQDNAAWILLLLPVHAVLAWDARRRA